MTAVAAAAPDVLPGEWTAGPAGTPAFHFSVDELAFEVYCEGVEPERAAADVGYFYAAKLGATASAHAVVVLQAAAPRAGPLPRAAAEEIQLLGYPSAPRSGRRWELGDWVVAESDRPAARYVVNRRTGFVRIVGSAADVLASFPRTLRLFLRRGLADHGYVRLHAAAVVLNGRGIAIAGPRGSGKTTLLVDLVRTAGARVVSFDKLFVRPAATLHCIGEPGSLGLALGTAQRFCIFLDRFPTLLRQLPPTAAWNVRAPAAKARLAAGDVAVALPPDPAPRHELTAILLADLQAGRRPAFERVGRGDAAEAISNLVIRGSSAHQPDWIGLGAETVDRNAASLVPTLAKRLPVYRVSFGEASPVERLPELQDAIAG